MRTTKTTTTSAKASAKKVAAKPVTMAPAKKPAAVASKTASASKTSAAKKTVAAPAASAKAPAKKAAPAAQKLNLPDAISSTMTMTQLIAEISSATAVSTKDVKAVLTDLNHIMMGSIRKKGAGTFMLAGMFKIVTKLVPAQKGGVKKPDPFNPGEFYITKAKPARTSVKIRPLAKLKSAAGM